MTMQICQKINALTDPMLTSFLFCSLIEVLKAQADRNKPMMGLVRSPVGMA